MMGIFNNLFSKKAENTTDVLEIADAASTGCMGKAEQIANVVAAGLEKENYSGMKEQLSLIAQKEEEKEDYIFEHPGIKTRYVAIAFLVCMSIIFVYHLLIGVGTVCLSNTAELGFVGIVFVVVSGIILLVNIVLIGKMISAVRFKKRYDSYEELLGYKSFAFVKDIATCTKQKEKLVVKDLKRAIKYKWIPQGHMSGENLVFIKSQDAYNRYMEKQTEYDSYFKKMLEERKNANSKTPQISKMIEAGEQYLEKFQRYTGLIKDKKISKKINRMEHIISMVFHELDVDSSQNESMELFLDCYFPTMEKLLDAYVTLEEKQTAGKNVNQIRKGLKETVVTVAAAFEDILGDLYEEVEIKNETPIQNYL